MVLTFYSQRLSISFLLNTVRNLTSELLYLIEASDWLKLHESGSDVARCKQGQWHGTYGTIYKRICNLAWDRWSSLSWSWQVLCQTKLGLRSDQSKENAVAMKKGKVWGKNDEWLTECDTKGGCRNDVSAIKVRAVMLLKKIDTILPVYMPVIFVAYEMTLSTENASNSYS